METLQKKIEQGMTTIDDAMVVSRIIGRLMRYEIALRDIAVHGNGGEAMKALTALVDEPHGRDD